jgi:hypothetical protein
MMGKIPPPPPKNTSIYDPNVAAISTVVNVKYFNFITILIDIKYLEVFINT